MPDIHPWGFHSPDLERRFLLHQYASTFWIDLGALLPVFLRQLWLLADTAGWTNSVTGSIHNAEGQADPACTARGNFWLCMVLVPGMLLLAVGLGRERYILYRGACAILWRVLFASGLASSMSIRPSCCSWCPWMWQHRLLYINLGTLLTPVPAYHYLLGGTLAWLVATVVDSADPLGACGQSVSCLVEAIQRLSGPLLTHHPCRLPAKIVQLLFSKSSWCHFMDMLLPGLVLIYFETRARSLWLAQQQQQLQHQHRQQQQQEHDQQQQQLSHKDLLPGSSAATAASCQQSLPHCTSAASSSPVAPPTSGQSAAAAAGAQGCMHVRATGAASPAAGASRVADSEPAALSAVPLDHDLAVAGHPADPAAAAQPAGTSEQQDTSSSCWSPGQRAAQSGLVSLKLRDPPGAGKADYATIQQQLTSALQARIDRLEAATGACGTAGCYSTSVSRTASCDMSLWVVTDCLAFPGCWQLLLQAITVPAANLPAEEQPGPGGGRGGAAAQQQQPAQGSASLQVSQETLHRLAQDVLKEWPGWVLLQARQLPVAGPAAAAGDQQHPDQGNLSALSAALAASPGFLRPLALPVPTACVSHSPAAGSSSSSGGAGTSSTGAAAARAAARESAELCMPGSVVQQLVAAGYRSVHVLVAQQPQAKLLLDHRVDLPLQSPPGTTSPVAGPGSSGEDVLLPQQAAAEAAEAAAAPVTDSCMFEDLQVPLPVSELLAGVAQQQQQQPVAAGAGSDVEVGVLSVLVIADGGSSRAAALTLDNEAAGPQLSSQVSPGPSEQSPADIQQQPAERPGGHLAGQEEQAAGATQPPEHVLAYLHLMLLPATAQAELQGFFQAVQELGLSYTTAYKQLLPLLQDWSLFTILTQRAVAAEAAAGNGSYASGGSSSSSSQPTSNHADRAADALQEQLHAAVTACLDEFEMTECYKLAMRQQWQYKQSQQRAAAAEARQLSGGRATLP